MDKDNKHPKGGLPPEGSEQDLAAEQNGAPEAEKPMAEAGRDLSPTDADQPKVAAEEPIPAEPVAEVGQDTSPSDTDQVTEVAEEPAPMPPVSAEPPAAGPPPPRTGSRLTGGLFVLSLVTIALLAGAYTQLNNRISTLEQGITGLQASVQDLPEATIEAIVAFQNGQARARAQEQEQAQQASASRTINIDNDAYLGDKSQAQLAIVEFSDFNCPYCARFHQETLEQILDKHVHTGHAIYVYRDFVGVGGATTHAAAAAAECVKEQLGDDSYLSLVHRLFASSGRKSRDMVVEYAQEMELDQASFDECVASDRYRQEVADDTQAGMAAGIRGTPGFIIGVLSEDGTVEGVHLPGAQQFAVFDRVISQLLEQEN